MKHLCILLLAASGLSFIGCGGCDKDSDAKPDVGQMCVSTECGANALCVDDTCQCRPGFEETDGSCNEIVLACAQDAECGNGACTDGQCVCTSGYAINSDGCADIDECEFGTDDCADSDVCTNTDGGFTCSCEGDVCNAFDECAAGAYDCPDASTCQDLVDGYECVCDSGYVLVGRSCARLVDCEAAPATCDANAVCTDTSSGLACVCGEGYAGDGTACDAEGFVQLAIGGGTNCGVRVDETIACWGQHPVGAEPMLAIWGWPRPIPEPSGEKWAFVDVAYNQVCAIRDEGSLWCSSGQSAFAQQGTDVNWSVVATAAGDSGGHRCALDNQGALFCWGNNDFGQLGLGDTTSTQTPTRVGADTWIALDTGPRQSCAIRADTTVWCWGGLTESWSNVPRQVDTTTGWSWVSFRSAGVYGGKSNGELFSWRVGDDPVARGTVPGNSFAATNYAECAVAADKTLWCRGANQFGQVGIPGIAQSADFLEVSDQPLWREVTSDESVMCAVQTSNDAYCWGRNWRGQVGGTLSIVQTPTKVIPNVKHRAVSVGINHMCAIRDSGALDCTGFNIQGSIGLRYDESLGLRRAITIDPGPWDTVAVGGSHTCTLRAGELYCFGQGSTGVLGLGEPAMPTEVPTRVGTAADWTAIRAHQSVSCGIRSAGELYCWGQNGEGQVGTGDTMPRYEPTRVGTESWSDVQPGNLHTCGIQSADASLWCWGANRRGELGTGDMAARTEPVRVDNARWVHVSTGVQYTMGVREDGSLWYWGEPAGVGLSISATPTQIGTATNWAQVKTDAGHACALTDSGDLFCMGSTHAGVVSSGSDPNTIVDLSRVGSKQWRELSATRFGVCTIDTSDELYCWGTDQFGELGTGRSWYDSPQRVRN